MKQQEHIKDDPLKNITSISELQPWWKVKHWWLNSVTKYSTSRWGLCGAGRGAGSGLKYKHPADFIHFLDKSSRDYRGISPGWRRPRPASWEQFHQSRSWAAPCTWPGEGEGARCPTLLHLLWEAEITTASLLCPAPPSLEISAEAEAFLIR